MCQNPCKSQKHVALIAEADRWSACLPFSAVACMLQRHRKFGPPIQVSQPISNLTISFVPEHQIERALVVGPAQLVSAVALLSFEKTINHFLVTYTADWRSEEQPPRAILRWPLLTQKDLLLLSQRLWLVLMGSGLPAARRLLHLAAVSAPSSILISPTSSEEADA